MSSNKIHIRKPKRNLILLDESETDSESGDSGNTRAELASRTKAPNFDGIRIKAAHRAANESDESENCVDPFDEFADGFRSARNKRREKASRDPDLEEVHQLAL